MENWKEYIDHISAQSENIQCSIESMEEDFAELKIYSLDRNFECTISTYAYFTEIWGLDIEYKFEGENFGFSRHFEFKNTADEENIRIVNNYLSPFLYEGWWIKKTKFLDLWYKSSMKNKKRNDSVGPVVFHYWGLLFWLISIFDLLSTNEWVYVKPLKDANTENT